MDLRTGTDNFFQVGESDFRTALARAKKAGVDSIVFNFVDQAALLAFLKEAKSIVPETRLFGLHDLDGYSTNPTFENLLQGVAWVIPEAPSTEFRKRYIARFKTEPLLTASNAYDALKILVQALPDTTSPDAVAAHLHSEVFSTVTFGSARFDNRGGIDAGKFRIRRG